MLDRLVVCNWVVSLLRGVVLTAGVGVLAFQCACGGGTSSTTGPPSPSITSVTLSPASANVQPGTTQQFTATVTGTGSFSPAVTWSLSVGNDNGSGSISTGGLYTAPTSAPNPNSVTVIATSAADLTKAASASVIIGSGAYDITGVTISPTSASLQTAQTQQFTASVQGTGTFSQGITWSVNGVPGGDSLHGTISTSGLYTGPEVVPTDSINVDAASAQAPGVTAMAQLTVTQGPPIITSLSPATANASNEIQVIGHGFVGTATVFFPGLNGVALAAIPNDSTSSSSQLSVVVPHSSVSGQLYVQIVPAAGPTQNSNSIAFTRLPRVRVRAARRDLSQGESTTFQSRIFAGSGSEVLSWTADVGSVTSNGAYTTPASVASDSFAVVTACVSGTQICDQERLGLHPFRISPDVPLVPLGGTVQLQAIQGSSVISPTWQLNGPGTLQNGTYTASAQVSGAGGVPITATYGGVTEPVSVGVTGGFPGLVNRVSDYVDLNQYPFPLGMWAVNLGIVGAKAYVLSTDQVDFVLDGNYYWVDVYDISDPAHPVWTDAFEAAARAPFLSCDGYLYQATDTDYSAGQPFPGVIAAYSTTGASPLLLSRQISPVGSTAITSQYGCLFTEISTNHYAPGPGEPLVVDLINLQNGSFVHTQYTVTIPATESGSLEGLTSDGSRLFVKFGFDLIVYDLTVNPPAQIGLLQNTPYGVGTILGIVGNLLFENDFGGYPVRTQVYDITNSQPTLLTGIPVGAVLGTSGTKVLTDSYDAGLQVVDVSNPQQPLFQTALFDFVYPESSAVISGTNVFAAEGNGGLAVYDASVGGGLLQSYLSDGNQGFVCCGPALAQASNASNLYLAIDSGGVQSGVLAYDLTTTPANFIGQFTTGSVTPRALALSNNNLFVGTESSLLVLDVTNPTTPAEIGSVGRGVISLAVSGNSLYAGTLDDRFLVFDITQPSNPVQVASLNLTAPDFEMAVSGNLLLVADGTAGLLVYNITTPAAPALLSQLQPSQAVFDVAVEGNLAFLAAWDAGLVIADITNPSQPLVTGQAALDTAYPYAALQSYLLNKAVSVAVLNKVAYVGVDNFDPFEFPNNGQAMIYGFDYTLPTTPRLVHLGAYNNENLSDGIITIRPVGAGLVTTNILAGNLQINAAQPGNTINLFYPPQSLRPPQNIGVLPPGSSAQPKRFSNTRSRPSPGSATPRGSRPMDEQP